MRRDDPFDDIFREIERMMQDVMGADTSGVGEPAVGETHVDVRETDDEVIVMADLPGVEKDDITLQCDGRVLSISAETDTRHYDERVPLPARVDEHAATAKYNNGVLEVTLDRADDSADIDVE